MLVLLPPLGLRERQDDQLKQTSAPIVSEIQQPNQTDPGQDQVSDRSLMTRPPCMLPMMLPDRNRERSMAPSGAIKTAKDRPLLASVMTDMLTNIVFRVRQLRNARGVHQTENVLRTDRTENSENVTWTRIEDMELGNTKGGVLPRSLEVSSEPNALARDTVEPGMIDHTVTVP